MKTSIANKHGRSNDPVWQFLAEFPLSEFLSEHDKGGELAAGLLFQTMRELGIPPEYLENIDMMLKAFAQEALMDFEQGSLELPGRIRVFCQKEVIDDANSAIISRPGHTEQSMEHAPITYRSGTIINEGWGCFLIKRGGNVSALSSLSPQHLVDLYLYKEG